METLPFPKDPYMECQRIKQINKKCSLVRQKPQGTSGNLGVQKNRLKISLVNTAAPTCREKAIAATPTIHEHWQEASHLQAF